MMLNQIEKQFNEFMVAMYGKTTISEAQEKDIEKSFYAGMLVGYNLLTNLDNDDDVALNQMEQITSDIAKKMAELLSEAKRE